MIENEPDPLRRIPAKHSIEARAEIGAALREARLKRGQSLESVAQQTRISKRYLDALENDRLDEFPAFVYMRGFLKSYCDHLDLPFDELWSKIEAPAPAASAAPAAAPAPVHAPAPTPSPTPAPAADERRSDPTATVAVLFSLALAVGLGIWIFAGRRGAEAPAPPVTPKALMPLPRAVEPKVVLRALDDAWVRALVDGTVVFEGRLPRGGVLEWKPSRTVSLQTTAPSALQLTVNDAPKPLLEPTADGEYRIDVP